MLCFYKNKFQKTFQKISDQLENTHTFRELLRATVDRQSYVNALNFY